MFKRHCNKLQNVKFNAQMHCTNNTANLQQTFLIKKHF